MNGKARTKECEGLEKEQTSVEEKGGRKRCGRAASVTLYLSLAIDWARIHSLRPGRRQKPSATGSVIQYSGWGN
jgi:hypothetical protein